MPVGDGPVGKQRRESLFYVFQNFLCTSDIQVRLLLSSKRCIWQVFGSSRGAYRDIKIFMLEFKVPGKFFVCFSNLGGQFFRETGTHYQCSYFSTSLF